MILENRKEIMEVVRHSLLQYFETETKIGKEEIEYFKNNPIQLHPYERSKESVRKKKICIGVCTYHNQNDKQDITEFLGKKSMKCNFTKGYVLSTWGDKETYIIREICKVCCNADKLFL